MAPPNATAALAKLGVGLVCEQVGVPVEKQRLLEEAQEAGLS
jgi:hypothetical protein